MKSDPWDAKLLKTLIELKEFRTISQHLKEKDINQLSPLECEAYIQSEAFLLNSHHAHLLYERFEIQNHDLKIRIHLNCGEFSAAQKLVNKNTDPFLQVEILLATNQYKKGLKLLNTIPISANWYYYMGRCQGHLYHFKLAIDCFQKAVEAYEKKNDRLRSTLSMANLAVYYQNIRYAKKAESLFKQIWTTFQSPAFDNFPLFKSKILINYGQFHLSQGNLLIALRHTWKAQRLLLNSIDSIEFTRASLYLADIFKELGHTNRAIALLTRVKPTKQYLQLDKMRLLIACWGKLGNQEIYLKYHQQALSCLDIRDQAGKILLLMDLSEANFCNEMIPEARLQAREALQLAQEIKDGELENYCLSRTAWHQKDLLTAQKTLPYHLKNKLLIDAYWDILTIAYGFMQQKKYLVALEELGKFHKRDLPVQQAYRFLLLGICYAKLDQPHHAQKNLLKALKLANSRNAYFTLTLIYRSILLLLPHADNFPHYFARYQEQLARLNHSLIPSLERTFLDLNLSCAQDFCACHADKEVALDQFNLITYRYSKTFIIIDLIENCLVQNGSINRKIYKNPIQWAMLELLARNRSQHFSKEALALQVFEKRRYNPQCDDNLIYVNINRLRKSLENKTLIDSKGGKYFLSADPDLIVLMRRQISEPEKNNLKNVLQLICQPDLCPEKLLREQSNLTPEDFTRAISTLLTKGVINCKTINANTYYDLNIQ